MKRRLYALLGWRLQVVLIASFSLVAVLTVGLNTLVISRVISDYLRSAEAERVARDMNLAESFYRIQLDDAAAISRRLVLDPQVVANLPGAIHGDEAALGAIDQQITTKISALALGGTHLISILDDQSNIVLARVVLPDGELSQVYTDGDLGCLSIVQGVLVSGQAKAATEVLPAECLGFVGLREQARVPLVDTPKAAPSLYDPREGSAGLALVGVSPFTDENGDVAGAALTAYMFNNDFTLVDRIKEAAGVDTATIFFGDLRVSTNVMTEEGNRAVGTRVSQEVYDVVLVAGEDYVGEAFVVNDTYITRYRPLRDHNGNVVGSLYVGALKSSFQALVDAFRRQALVIALVCMILAGVVAIPIARVITRPIAELVDANRRLAKGDMSVRVEPYGRGELAVLGQSFNNMALTLEHTQQELVQKEKLASMGQLAAGVAHEINNPLGTILLFSDVIYKGLPADDPRREDIKMIIDETTRCKTIVADLLNFAREQKVLIENTDINALLDNVIELMILQPIFDNVKIERLYSAELPIIQADPAQLKQVFINLLSNAAEAMPDGGAIRLTTRSLDTNWIQIEITDDGVGISPENLNKLFTPFFTTKGSGKGTGLGLSIVYGIIKMHRGQIAAQSKIGEGTSFIVTLPTRLPDFGLNRENRSSELIG